MAAVLMINEESVDDIDIAAHVTTKVAALTNAVTEIMAIQPDSTGMATVQKVIEHVTPDEESLSSITVNISCPQGCPRTFANSSALRLHLKQVHHKTYSDSSFSAKPGSEVLYHCPVKSCIYHESMGKNGKHFPKLKYLKQHYLKVHATRTHKCDCGQAFSTGALLAHHQRVCGLNLICVCGRTFSRFETLQTHVRRRSHVIHSSTLQALRSRKISIAQTVKPAQEIWAHGIPIRHQRLEDLSKKDGNIEVTVSASPASVARSIPPDICPAPTSSSFTQVASLNIAHPIHLLAAVALGEIKVTAVKRLPSVDVGVQTDGEVVKRWRRKSSSPGRWDPGGSQSSSSRGTNKRKRTAETQTRLTHRGNKKRNSGKPEQLLPRIVPEGSHAEDVLGMTENPASEPSFLDVSADDCSNGENSLGSLTLQIDLPDLISSQSSSGTQTSPRAGGLARSHVHNISLSLFDRACGDDEPTIRPPSITSMTSTQTPQHLDPFAGTQLLLEEDEDLLEVVGKASAMTGQPPLLTHIPLSSTETQTDHDVLLSENAGAPDEVDEIILTNTETQTDPNNLLIMNGASSYEPSTPCQATAGPCDIHGSDSIWCTSETQTYEDFSDIEQFMRSTIHTQTPDHSHSELFPELSFTHTQTQTCIDDPPALVTTHTQTPTHTHFPTDMY